MNSFGKHQKKKEKKKNRSFFHFPRMVVIIGSLIYYGYYILGHVLTAPTVNEKKFKENHWFKTRFHV